MERTGKKLRVDLLVFASYMAAIEKSVGSRLFQSVYAKVNGRKEDILRGGELSCALFASSILLLFGLIRRKHANVDPTVRSMRRAGWREIARPRIGAVIVWAEKDFGKGSLHKHIGFYVGKGEAVSNSYFKRMPVRHPVDSPRLGVIEAYFWHDSLENNS